MIIEPANMVFNEYTVHRIDHKFYDPWVLGKLKFRFGFRLHSSRLRGEDSREAAALNLVYTVNFTVATNCGLQFANAQFTTGKLANVEMVERKERKSEIGACKFTNKKLPMAISGPVSD